MFNGKFTTKVQQVKNHFLTVCLLGINLQQALQSQTFAGENINVRKISNKAAHILQLGTLSRCNKKRLRKAVSFLKIIYYVCNSILQNA